MRPVHIDAVADGSFFTASSHLYDTAFVTGESSFRHRSAGLVEGNKETIVDVSQYFRMRPSCSHLPPPDTEPLSPQTRTDAREVTAFKHRFFNRIFCLPNQGGTQLLGSHQSITTVVATEV